MKDELKATDRSFQLDNSVCLTTCCEPECRISILIEKDMKNSNIQTRCVSCLMTHKLRYAKSHGIIHHK